MGIAYHTVCVARRRRRRGCFASPHRGSYPPDMRIALSFGSLALALGSAAALPLACSSPTPSPPASPTDAGADASAPPDAAKPSPPPLAPAFDPEPLTVPSWLITTNREPQTADPVRIALESGAFTTPPAGTRADGTWIAKKTNPNGGISTPSNGTILYAAADVEVPPGRRVFARPDAVISLWTDSVLVQPGDLYRSGRVRVPAIRGDGTHGLVVRGNGGRGEVQLELWSTPDELYMNLADLTAPDPEEGDRSTEWLGVPVLNLSATTAFDVKAKVEASDLFEATTTVYPAFAAGAVTNVAFELKPRAAMPAAGTKVSVGVRVESDSLDFSYRRDVDLGAAVAPGATRKRTFRSAMDGSAQFFGVVQPAPFDKGKKYGVVLSLHGAGVGADGQAKAYAPKDWTYVVAATNRRPFGFDWESFGRRDAIEVLDHAMSIFNIDPTRVYLSGHSMGGHGTWNVGVNFPGRFATLGPSAGWESYYSYAGLTRPTGASARSQAPSDTLAYLSNLAKRGVYVIHGTADTNVPFAEGQKLFDAVSLVSRDVDRHWEQGANHWWDKPGTPGADCVDWPPLFDFMKARTLDLLELDFTYATAGPWVNPRHSYVSLRSQVTAFADSVLTSSRSGDTVTLVTKNVRSMDLDGAGLDARGVKTVLVDGTAMPVTKGEMPVGPRDGKRPLVHGPINEVFYRPFCFAWQDDAPAAYARWASYVLSSWQVNGNGQGCALPLSRVTGELRKSHNIVYLGVPSAKIPAASGLPVSFGSSSIVTAAGSRSTGVIAVVFPDGDRLSGAVMATTGSENLLTRFMPLRPVASPPDFIVFDTNGSVESAFFDPTWKAIVTQ